MNITDLLAQLSWHDIQEWLKEYEALGPVPGIAAPMIESFLPFLPLVAILVANVNAYGLWEGILLSWIGVVIGSFSVFWLVRTFGGRFRGFLERRIPRSRKFIHWLEEHGFTPLFLLACFPFTPSSVVNVVAGISKVPIRTFLTATALGKGVMIALVSFVGQDLGELFAQPWRLLLIAGVLLVLWLLGRKLESKYLH